MRSAGAVRLQQMLQRMLLAAKATPGLTCRRQQPVVYCSYCKVIQQIARIMRCVNCRKTAATTFPVNFAGQVKLKDSAVALAQQCVVQVRALPFCC
jgi:hypothetical protein